MEFQIKTDYDQQALTAMAKALRKTIRRKHSRRSHYFGWIITILGGLLIFNADEINAKLIVTIFSVILIVAALIWEDSINGYVAKKRGLPGMDTSITTFREWGYHSETAIGASDFHYDTVLRFVAVKDYFVFIFSTSHAQVYDKRSLSGGSEAEFVAFITEKTGKHLEVI